MKKNIYIVGFMGTGKSTIGKELARLLGRRFLDMDAMLEKSLGMTINEIFEREGEEFFRAEEKKLAFELIKTNNQVISTGGGTINDEDVREAFSKNGIMICLFADRDNLISRLQRTDKRPLLKGDSLEKRVNKLMNERMEIYDKIPLRVNTTNLSPKEAAAKIVDLFKIRQKILDQLQNQYIIIS
jgi:shikimate kinase